MRTNWPFIQRFNPKNGRKPYNFEMQLTHSIWIARKKENGNTFLEYEKKWKKEAEFQEFCQYV